MRARSADTHRPDRKVLGPASNCVEFGQHRHQSRRLSFPPRDEREAAGGVDDVQSYADDSPPILTKCAAQGFAGSVGGQVVLEEPSDCNSLSLRLSERSADT